MPRVSMPSPVSMPLSTKKKARMLRQRGPSEYTLVSSLAAWDSRALVPDSLLEPLASALSPPRRYTLSPGELSGRTRVSLTGYRCRDEGGFQGAR